MKHTGKTPAIYQTTRYIYLRNPGELLPRNAVLVLGHADAESLELAYSKSTYGKPSGQRVNGSYKGYGSYLVEVLARVLSDRIEPVSKKELEVLRHALGASHVTTENPNLGWRNYYNADESCYDFEVIKGLVERGLMSNYAKDFYRATERGAILAGIPAEEAGYVARGAR